ERLPLLVQPLELGIEPVGARLDQAVALGIPLERRHKAFRERADERLDGLGIGGERFVEPCAVERDLALNVGREAKIEQSLEATAWLAVRRAEDTCEARFERAQRGIADERTTLRNFGACTPEVADLRDERVILRDDVVERLAYGFVILLDGDR